MPNQPILRAPSHVSANLVSAVALEATPRLSQPARVVGRPEAVPVVRPVHVTQVPTIALLDPGLAKKLIDLETPAAAGIPRASLTIPVSPSADVTDEILFENPGDASKKFYLPRYRLAEQPVNGHPQYRAALAQDGQGWALTLHLEKYPAPAIETASHGAREIEHTCSVTLHHKVMMGTAPNAAATKELAFQEVISEATEARAVLRVASLPERDQLYRVLTDPQYGAMLIVRRLVHVAVPLQRPPAAQTVSTGTAVIRGTFSFDFDSGTESLGGDVFWEQFTATTRAMVPKGNAKLANLGMISFDAVTPAQLPGLAYGTAPLSGSDDATDKLTINDVFAVRTNGGNFTKVQVLKKVQPPNSVYLLTVRWVTYRPGAAGGSVLYQEVTPALDVLVTPSPFVFPPDLHAYIFSGIRPGAGPSTGLVRRQVGTHVYYQDVAQPYVFYYLPDTFKLLRRAKSPHYPVLSIRFSAAGQTRESTQATLEFAASPAVDLPRLQADAPTLRPLAEPLPRDVSGPVFQPLLLDADKIRFSLALPGAQGAGPMKDRPGTRVDLRAGFTDNLTLSLDDFREVYNALFGGSLTLMQGEVEVKLGDQPDLNPPPIPFTGRLNDFFGDVFDYAEAPDAASGSVRVTFTNAIESPVTIKHLAAELRRGDNRVNGQFQGLTLTPPPVLHPGDSLSFVVAPTTPLAGAGAPEVRFDLAGVEAQLDPGAVWNAVLNPTAPAEYSKAIAVQGFAPMFARVQMIVVDFERGDTSVSLDAQHLTAQAKVFLPIADWVLDRVDQGEYRYKLTVVHPDGHQTHDADWRKETSTILIPEVA
jgi:hypothetical protein